jgi:F0F1-type ATP synthase assembly protein I
VKILAAGGTFAGATIIGLLVGIFIAGRTGQQLWVLAGIFLGLGAGGYSALRLLMGELR